MTTPPVFLDVEARVLDSSTPSATANGTAVRPASASRGLLESAVAMPSTAAFGGQFVHAGLVEMAAAYLFHVNKNHPFPGRQQADGGRGGPGVPRLLNGVRTSPRTQGEMTAITLAVAAGEADKSAAADFFGRHWPAGSPPRDRGGNRRDDH